MTRNGSIPRRLDLGCGTAKPDGFYGVDIRNTDDVDQVVDLDAAPWPLPSDHFTYVRAIDVYEHVDHPVRFLEEVYRVTRPGGTVVLQCPHRSSQNWTDPTHQRLCGWNTVTNYFTRDGPYAYYSDAEFTVEDRWFTFSSRKCHLPQRLAAPVLQRIPEIYENTVLSRVLPAKNIVYVLSVPPSDVEHGGEQRRSGSEPRAGM